MDSFNLRRRLSGITGLVAAYCLAASTSSAALVTFDLPSSVECRDVTSDEFAANNPTLKVIEARFRISARMIDGTPSDIIEFFYSLKTSQTMRITEYSPNTTLESTVDSDHIDVTDATENAKATGADGHVAFAPFALGGSHNRSSKKLESSHYKQIAAKDVILSSGTTDREHGVFYRLRPSRTDSLEGGKEFTFLATVPKHWTGDLCSISCAAKGSKRSMLSTSLVTAGSNQVQIGMYLAGNLEAAHMAEDLRRSQDLVSELSDKIQTNGNVFKMISTQTVGLLTGKSAQQRQELESAQQAVTTLQQRIEKLSK